MKMTRRVTFSAGHRYWLSHLSKEENQALFGKWASPYNHGHNYVLDVTTAGVVNPTTGMIINIKRIDDLLKKVVLSVFDQKSINDEVETFEGKVPSTENLILDIAERLKQLPKEASLTHLRLQEMPRLWTELNLETNQMTLTRTYEFAASHRLHADTLTQEENLELFGKCNNLHGHGHNYVLEVTVTGTPDPITGFICDLGELDRAVNERVVDRYDHKNLNLDIEEFGGKVTTSEVVSQEIWNRLVGNVPGELYRIRLHETARNIFEVTA